MPSGCGTKLLATSGRPTFVIPAFAHARQPKDFSGDRVGSAGLRPLTLPHHRTCGFPHPAVEPLSLLSGSSRRIFLGTAAQRSPRLHRFSFVAAGRGGGRSCRAPIVLFSFGSSPDSSSSSLVLQPFAPTYFHRPSTLLRLLLTSPRLSQRRSPRVSP